MAKLYASKITTDEIFIAIVELDPEWDGGDRIVMLNYTVNGITRRKQYTLTTNDLFQGVCTRSAKKIENLPKDTECYFTCAIKDSKGNTLGDTLELKVKTLSEEPTIEYPIDVGESSISVGVVKIHRGWIERTNALRCVRWYIAKENESFGDYDEETILEWDETSASHNFEGLDAGVYYLKCEIVHKMPIAINNYTEKFSVMVQYTLDYSVFVGSAVGVIEMKQGARQSLTFSWGAVAGAEVYKTTLKDDDSGYRYTKNTSDTSVTFSGLEGGTPHTFEVSYSIGKHTSEKATKRGCYTRPKFPVIKGVKQLSNSKIEISWTIEGNADGLTFLLYCGSVTGQHSGGNVVTNVGSEGTAQINFIFHGAGKYCLCYGSSHDEGGKSWTGATWNELYYFELSNMAEKPEHWEWVNPGKDGYLEVDGNFEIRPVTYNEWNDLRRKINIMRVYRGMESFDFGKDVSKGDDFAYDLYNDVRRAIQEIGNGAGSFIPELTGKTFVEASLFETLRDEFNAAVDNL